jgi:hypothetical protein
MSSVTPVRRSNISSPGTAQASMLTPFIDVIPYTLTGFLTDSAPTTSPLVTPRNTLYLIGFSATLGSAGSGTSTVELLVNGQIIATLELTAGKSYAFTNFQSVQVRSRTDTYCVSVPTAGAGAANLGGEIEFRT